MKVILWWGLKRSGNHGILNLILKSTSPSMHLNDVSLSYDHFKVIQNEPFVKNINPKLCNNNGIDREYIGCLGSALTVLSMEDKMPNFADIKKFEKSQKTLFKCLIIRNPFDMLISIYKEFEQSHSKLMKSLNMWFEQVKNILNNNYKMNGFILISYDKFYESEQYRQNIFTKLEINYDKIKKYLDVRKGHARSSWRNCGINCDKKQYFSDDAFFCKNVTNNQILKNTWLAIKNILV